MGVVHVQKGLVAIRTPQEPPVRYIRAHAALRGVAAMMVVAYHLQFGAFHRLAIETATPFFERGYLLVDLFFILSGFVISLTSDADRARPFSAGEIYDFYVARLARIYPLHLFCLCAIAACTITLAAFQQWHHSGLVSMRFDPNAAGSFAAELLLIQAWIAGAPRWNIPSWSVSAELFAYALFPLILSLRSRVPRIARSLLLLLPLTFYLTIMNDSGSLDILTGLAPLRCLSGFMIGMILFDVRAAADEWTRFATAAYQLIAVAGIVAMLATRVPDPIIIPFFALLVIATWQDKGPLPALLLHRIFARLGELSYSIYLTHVGVIAIIVPIWYSIAVHIGLGGTDASRIALIAICFGTILIVSRETYARVEQPSRRRLRRALSRFRRS